VGGVFMLRELKQNKQALQSDPYAFLPTGISGFVQINKPEYLIQLTDSVNGLEEVIKNLNTHFTYPLLIVDNEKDSYVLSKIDSRQETEIKKILDEKVFPYYPAKERIYNEVKLLFYPAEDTRFFVCMFYKNLFVGGYNFELLEKIVDVDLGRAVGVYSTPLGRETIRKIESYYPANLFLNNKSGFSVFNIDFKENQFRMEGYDTDVVNKDWTCDNKRTYDLDYSIFPNHIESYQADYYDPYVTDSFKCYFDKPSYSFIIYGQSNPVYALKNSDDKFIIYNILNALEERYIGRLFKKNDFFHDYRIYTTSAQLARQVFGFTTPAYIVFYKEYFVFSADKDSLKEYILNNGKYSSDFRIDDREEDIISVFYTNDPDKWYPDFFLPNHISRNMKGGLYVVSAEEDKTRKSKIFMDN